VLPLAAASTTVPPTEPAGDMPEWRNCSSSSRRCRKEVGRVIFWNGTSVIPGDRAGLGPAFEEAFPTRRSSIAVRASWPARATIWQVPPAGLSFTTDHCDRMWAAAEELRMPINLHINTGHGYHYRRRWTGHTRRR
jgi:hypothetical protein